MIQADKAGQRFDFLARNNFLIMSSSTERYYQGFRNNVVIHFTVK